MSKQQLVSLVEDSELLKNWKSGKAIMYNTCFDHKEVRSLHRELKQSTHAPENFPEDNWIGSKLIAKVLKQNGVKCQVLRGNGSTSPSGSDKATNYFIVERDDSWSKNATNTLYLNFEMTTENVKEIIAILEKHYIAFVWDGTLGSCILFHLDKNGFPE